MCIVSRGAEPQRVRASEVLSSRSASLVGADGACSACRGPQVVDADLSPTRMPGGGVHRRRAVSTVTIRCKRSDVDGKREARGKAEKGFAFKVGGLTDSRNGGRSSQADG